MWEHLNVELDLKMISHKFYMVHKIQNTILWVVVKKIESDSNLEKYTREERKH